MIKKVLIFISLIFFSFFNISSIFAVNCSYEGVGNVVNSIEDCLEDSTLVKTENIKDENGKIISSDNLKVDDGFKEVLINWTTKIATYLAFGAIFAISFGSLKMVLSGGEEEAIKKGKDVIKWGILGLLGVVSAGFIISVVVKIVYTIGG